MTDEWGISESEMDDKAWGDTTAEQENNDWGIEHDEVVVRKMNKSLGEHEGDEPEDKYLTKVFGEHEDDEKSHESDKLWGAKE